MMSTRSRPSSPPRLPMPMGGPSSPNRPLGPRPIPAQSSAYPVQLSRPSYPTAPQRPYPVISGSYPAPSAPPAFPMAASYPTDTAAYMPSEIVYPNYPVSGPDVVTISPTMTSEPSNALVVYNGNNFPTYPTAPLYPTASTYPVATGLPQLPSPAPTADWQVNNDYWGQKWHTEASHYQWEIQNLRKELEFAYQRLQATGGSKTQAFSALQNLRIAEANWQAARREAMERQAQLAQASADIQNKQAQLTQANAEFQAAQLAQQQMGLEIQSVHVANANLKQQMGMEIQSCQAANSELQQHLANSRQEVNGAWERLKAAEQHWHQMLQQAEVQRRQTETYATEVSMQLANAKADNQNLTTSRAGLIEQLEYHKRMLASAQAEIGRLTQFEGQVPALRSEVSYLQAQVVRMRELEERYVAVGQEADALRSSIMAQEQHISQYSAQTENYYMSTSNEVQKLRQELAQLGARLQNATAEIRRSHAQIVTADAEIARLRKELDVAAGYFTQLQFVQAQFSDASAEIDRLVARLTDAGVQGEGLTLQLQETIVQRDELRVRFQESTMQRDELRARLQEISARLQETSIQRDELVGRLQELSARNEDVVARLSEAGMQGEQLTASYQQEVQAHQHDRSTLTAELTAVQEELAALAQQSRGYFMELQAIKAQFSVTETELQCTQNRLQEAMAEADRYMSLYQKSIVDMDQLKVALTEEITEHKFVRGKLSQQAAKADMALQELDRLAGDQTSAMYSRDLAAAEGEIINMHNALAEYKLRIDQMNETHRVEIEQLRNAQAAELDQVRTAMESSHQQMVQYRQSLVDWQDRCAELEGRQRAASKPPAPPELPVITRPSAGILKSAAANVSTHQDATTLLPPLLPPRRLPATVLEFAAGGPAYSPATPGFPVSYSRPATGLVEVDVTEREAEVPASSGRAFLGLEVAEGAELINQYGEPNPIPALRVVNVFANSPCEQAGLEPGDLISSLDGKQVATLDDFTKAVSTVEPRSILKVVFERAGQLLGCYVLAAEAAAPDVSAVNLGTTGEVITVTSEIPVTPGGVPGVEESADVSTENRQTPTKSKRSSSTGAPPDATGKASSTRKTAKTGAAKKPANIWHP